MPQWCRQCFFILIFLVALANFEAVGEGILQLAGAVGDLFRSDLFHYREPERRFAMAGLLVLMVVAMWAIFWKNRGDNNQNNNP